ncbi:hypothetical protein CPB83DRAFT_857103 [Crepidotus variabilis]|uniref:Uncharacterized protein n=1 Tax=Crepidotus variabilis TaxID=179855 RepID=A0A9P6ED55_9AGAR|nr:hypothetical protein CPB83DRAFT_857103 [Crepidotus variabilis]
MSATDLNPRFPPELEYLIFEMAYTNTESSAQTDILNLILVAKRVYEWLRPFLFRVLEIHVIHEDDLYFRPWLASLEDVGKFVRHLFVHSSNVEGTKRILGRCTNAHNVALWWDSTWIDSVTKPEGLGLLQTHTAIKTLSTEAEYLGLSNLPVGAYPHLTHLDILNTEHRSWEYWSPLSTLPSLSHLALTSPIVGNHAKQLLGLCKKLQMLIIFNDPDKEDLLDIQDPRLLMIYDYHYSEGVSDFHAVMRSKPGLWEFADRLRHARKYDFFRERGNRDFSRTIDWLEELTEEGTQWYKGLKKKMD